MHNTVVLCSADDNFTLNQVMIADISFCSLLCACESFTSGVFLFFLLLQLLFRFQGHVRRVRQLRARRRRPTDSVLAVRPVLPPLLCQPETDESRPEERLAVFGLHGEPWNLLC